MGPCQTLPHNFNQIPQHKPYNNKNNNNSNYNKNNHNINHVSNPFTSEAKNPYQQPIKYDYNLYKQKYLPQNKYIKTEKTENVPQINNNKNNYDINHNLNNLKAQYKNLKINNRHFFDDVEEQEKYIENYRAFISELNLQINNLKDKLNISLTEEKLKENLLNKEENEKLLNDLENISYKINEFSSLLEMQKSELKNLENNFLLIQNRFNELKNDLNNNNDEQTRQYMFVINSNSIKEQMKEIEEIENKLINNKKLYDEKKQEIESDIKKLQSKTEEKVTQIKTKHKENFKKKYYQYKPKDYNQLNDSLFIRGSMLLDIKDFGKANNIFNTMYIFNEKEDEDDFYEKQSLIKKNYYEKCYINDEYDIHDITYELKAVGLQEHMYFTTSSYAFHIDTKIKILDFEIDGLRQNYEYEKYSMRFKIKLKNLESVNIHLKFQESPLLEKMTLGARQIRDIYRSTYYGVPKRLSGQNAKFILINNSNFEIINFSEEIFLKKAENQYEWGGRVPKWGKITMVRLSKKEARINFYEKHTLRTINKLNLTNTLINIPLCYLDGNNTIIKFNYGSKQTKNITFDKVKKIFSINYFNCSSNIGQFEIKGILTNKCKGEWIVKLTNEEIEALVPYDYKVNKNYFRDIANQIIFDYDKEHKDDIIIVPTVAKIGKWVKKNIKYDITYVGRNDITATETFNEKRGVCHHITRLFNAFMYSLGYQVIYALGYAIDSKKNFAIEDAHAWSLIKIEGKWLPFDATWGIFSGKLPVTHVFKQTDCKGVETKTYDKIKINQIFVNGQFN